MYIPTTWEPQILIGAVRTYNPSIRGHEVTGGTWQSVGPTIPETAPPYRYPSERDALAMLDRLRPDLPAEFKRAVKV
jgi:hypothetical protein